MPGDGGQRRPVVLGKESCWRIPYWGREVSILARVKLRCRSCGRSTEAIHDHPYHAGFSDVCFLYCDRESSVVTFSVYDPTYESLSNGKVAWDGRLNTVERRRVEENLLPCPCGGRFSFENPLRCPHCGAALADSIL